MNHLAKPPRSYLYKSGIDGSCPQRSISGWGQERIEQMNIAVRHGNFQAAQLQLEQLREHGLDYEPTLNVDVTPETFLCQVYDSRISGFLEKHLGALTFRQLLQTRPERLREIPRIGIGIHRQIIQQCRSHFGDDGQQWPILVDRQEEPF